MDFSYDFSYVEMAAAYALPSRVALCLGDRTIMYLPRCADTDSEVRKVSAQVCKTTHFFFCMLLNPYSNEPCVFR